jgi:hypothetical protein
MGDITFSDLTTWVVAAATLYILAYLSHKASLWIERQKAEFMEGWREGREKRKAWL